MRAMSSEDDLILFLLNRMARASASEWPHLFEDLRRGKRLSETMRHLNRLLEVGAPAGPTNGAWRHGLHTKESVEARRRLNDLARDAKVVLRQLAGGMADEIIPKG